MSRFIAFLSVTAFSLSKEGKRIIYCVYEYEPLLDSANMTIDDYGLIANDIKVEYLDHIKLNWTIVFMTGFRARGPRVQGPGNGDHEWTLKGGGGVIH